MVGILPRKRADMQCHPGVSCHSMEELFHQLGGKGPDAAIPDIEVNVSLSTTAKVESTQDEGFIHWDRRIPVTGNTRLVAKGLAQRHPEDNPDILDRVVVIDVQIPACVDGQNNQPMAGDLGEHVLEEADAGGEGGCALSIEVDGEVN